MGKKSRRKQETAQAEAVAQTNGKGKAEGRKRTPRETLVEYAKAIGSAVLIALVLRQFLFQAFRIPTGSMLETLQIGDYLFVNKFLYGAKTPDRIRLGNLTLMDGLPVLKLPAIREPRQGDIIVFEYPRDRNLDYIKRCVAVAGDTVTVREGVLYVNGEAYESNFGERDGDHSCVPTWTDPESCPPPRAKKDQASYVRNPRNHAFPWNGQPNPYVVEEGHIFMMGDNRFNSMDSRYWGALDTDLIKGKALFIYMSLKGDFPWVRFERIGDLIR